ncbi:MAG: type II toxin-antitoxin system RelE/ParE family toxin, partial [Clostridia bacterium]
YQYKIGIQPKKYFLITLTNTAQKNKHDRIQYNKISAYIKALQVYGTRIGKPTVKHIDGDLWELRPLENRIFFFYWHNDTFVLLSHFIKKSQKTPTKEIAQARANLKDFLERIDKK